MKFIYTIVLICLASATGASSKHNLSLSADIKESGGDGGDYGGTSTYYTTCYAPETSTVVITSCSENSCATKSHETGITVVTTITLGVSTVFTTYCPLSTEHQVIEKTDSAGQVTTSTIPIDTDNPQPTSDDCENEDSDDEEEDECDTPTSCHTCAESTSSSATSEIISSVSVSSTISEDVSMLSSIPSVSLKIESSSSIKDTSVTSTSESTEYTTIYAPTTSTITITSCDEGSCHTSTVPTGITIVTETGETQVTTYTTYCPTTEVVPVTTPSSSVDLTSLSESPSVASTIHSTSNSIITSSYLSSESYSTTLSKPTETTEISKSSLTSSKPSTTKDRSSSIKSTSITIPSSLISASTTIHVPTTSTITMTSCDENECTTSEIETGITIVTTTNKSGTTSYTTYCPLTTESNAELSTIESSWNQSSSFYTESVSETPKPHSSYDASETITTSPQLSSVEYTSVQETSISTDSESETEDHIGSVSASSTNTKDITITLTKEITSTSCADQQHCSTTVLSTVVTSTSSFILPSSTLNSYSHPSSIAIESSYEGLAWSGKPISTFNAILPLIFTFLSLF